MSRWRVRIYCSRLLINNSNISLPFSPETFIVTFAGALHWLQMHWIIPQILCYFLSKGLFWRLNSSRPNTERLCCLLPQWVQNVKLCLTFNRETFSTDLTCDWLTDLLDAGIYAYYYSRYDGGAHNGLALDDPFFYHPQHYPHWTLHGEFCLNAAETCWVMEVDVCLWLTCSLFSFLVYSRVCSVPGLSREHTRCHVYS